MREAEMNILFFVITVILVGLLILSFQRNASVVKEKEQYILARDTALDISNRVVNTKEPAELYQYILEACLKLIPKAKFGSILMFNTEGLLTARASIGFNRDEINRFRLKLEESFLYIATKGKLDKTVIINRLEDLVLPQNIVNSGDQGFAIRSEVSAPLRVGGELAGLLCIDGDQNGIFSEQDIYILDYMASQIGIVIRNQKMYSEMLRISRYDGLSNLLNRDSFDREAEKLLKDPSRDTSTLHYVLMDLDNLKMANDTIGHHFGDEVIKSFSALIQKYLGKNDLFGRYGGDEFAAVIQGDPLNVSHCLEDASNEFTDTKVGLLATEFVPSFSYGIACFQESDLNLDTLYKLADKRMYDLKARKKRHADHS
jgi:diguanylate cyclase (GGDEF)-like protein